MQLPHAGGEEEVSSNEVPSKKAFTKSSNAYMLVYVRESDWARMMREPTEADIDAALRGKFAVSGRSGWQWREGRGGALRGKVRRGRAVVGPRTAG